ETREEESFDPIPQTTKRNEDEGNGAEDIGLNVEREEGLNEEEEEDELYKDVNINQGRGIQATLEVEDNHVTLTLTPTSVAPLPITTPTMTSSTIATTTTTSQAPILPTTVLSDIIQNLPNFGSLFRFDDRLRSLEENFSEVMQTNQFAGDVSAIPIIVQQYMGQRMNEAIKVAVKDQVKVQVLKILPRIEKAVNEQLEAEVLTRSSHSSRTSYAIVADLSEMELKKILIEKMEGNKSIQRSDEQRNLYKALVEAYESDKIILDTYGETVTLKRRHDDDVDKDEEPFAGPDRGSKRRREGKEPKSARAPTETATRSDGSLHKGPGLCGLMNQYAMINMPSGKSPIEGVNVSSSTVSLLIGSLLAMCIPREESMLSRNSDCRMASLQALGLDNGVESYQKKLNLTKPDTYRSDLKRLNEEEDEDELYRDVNINQGRGIQATLEVEDTHVTLTPVNPDGMESIFETTSQIDVQTPTSVAPLPITTPTMTSSTIATTTTTSQAPILPTIVLSDIIQNLPNFGSLFCFDDRLRSLEENFSEVMQTNQFAVDVSAIPIIVQQYMGQRMNEAIKVAVQIQSDWLRDEAQRENDDFLRTVDENIKKIIKEQVKDQVKVQVLKILPRIEQAVNEQLEAEVLTRSSHSSRTSYAIVADLFEMELKKILIEKIEGNKSIQRSDEQRNLYKALVEAYESDKIILDTYGETVTLKRRRDDDVDKDEEPFAGPDRGSKRRREGKEPKSASAPTETATRSAEELYKATIDQLDWVNPEGQQYLHNLLQPLPLIPDNRGRRVIPFAHFINNDLEYLRGGTSSRKYTTSITKTKAADYGHIKWIEDLVPRTISTVSLLIGSLLAMLFQEKNQCCHETQIVEWHSYKHLDWITVRRDDDKLYKFKEADFKRLRIQDIKDMLLLLVQDKLTNLTVEERFAFNVSL
nr:hypothetical protein [Tanacetum cinerariifolium]